MSIGAISVSGRAVGVATIIIWVGPGSDFVVVSDRCMQPAVSNRNNSRVYFVDLNKDFISGIALSKGVMSGFSGLQSLIGI